MTKSEAYELLYGMADGIAKMFGKNCETVVQELIDEKFVMIAIFNGHVSGREVQSTQGILGGTLSSAEIDYTKIMSGVYNQLVVHPTGKKIKSSSFVLKGEDYLYILGINFDVTLFDAVKLMLGDFTAFEGELFTTLQREKENTLDNIFTTCVQVMHANIHKMKKEERVVLIRMLNEHNFFNIQKSVPFLSEKLGVSKYTIYKYLNEIGAQSADN